MDMGVIGRRSNSGACARAWLTAQRNREERSCVAGRSNCISPSGVVIGWPSWRWRAAALSARRRMRARLRCACPALRGAVGRCRSRCAACISKRVHGRSARAFPRMANAQAVTEQAFAR